MRIKKSIKIKMETIDHSTMRKDNQLLVITHLTQLLTYITGFGGFIVPLIIWLSQRDRVEGMNEHGKAIVNFQLTILLLTIISIPAILLLGLGIIALIIIGIVAFVQPIINAIAASRGDSPSYFMTINFIS